MGLNFDPIAAAAQNWDRHGFAASDAMVAATSITRAHQILLGRINEALSPLGVTFSRFEVLALLYFASENELPMGKIGDRLQVHPTSVTSLVGRLVDDELVTRRSDERDRRLTLVRLTKRGAKLVPEGAERLAAIDYGLTGLSDAARRRTVVDLGHLRRESGDWSE